MSDWTFPGEVSGWLSEAEGRALADLARDKRVLEIGSYEGRSTICMAQTAAHVVCIDPCDGRATKGADRDTDEALVANLKRYGVWGNVELHVGTTAEVAPELAGGGFDLVFIDGDHSAAALEIDLREALRLLAPGGLIAFHDYGRFGIDQDVTVAVNQLTSAGAELLGVTDSLAVVRPGPPKQPGKPVVFLAMPRRGAAAHFGACQGYFLWPTNGACEVVRSHRKSSLLDFGFNCLWAAALNCRERGITHFAMIHDDVSPCQGWLDVLLAELARTGADVVSAVIPIKTDEGATSTAVETDDVWAPRRLTMTEVYGLPETFTDADVGGEILLNSGLWVCDLREPWVDVPEPLSFQCLNRIVRDGDGKWQAQVRSEDWEFSRAARARGAKLYATRKVVLSHGGEQEYPNDQAWGTWKTDEVYQQRVKRAEAARV